MSRFSTYWKSALLLLLTAGFGGLSAFGQDADAALVNLANGGRVFQTQCTRCHIPVELQTRLRNDWSGQTGQLLAERIAATMPGENPGTLNPQQVLDVTAFVLDAGGVELPARGNLTVAALNNLVIRPENKVVSGAGYDWSNLNGNIKSTRYAELDQINAQNVADVELAWEWSSANIGPVTEGLGVTSPIVVNGTLYTTAGLTRNIVALDPATGQMLWLWRPQEGERFNVAPRKGSGKGLAYWSDGVQETILTVTPGYYLVALNAKTGLPVESFGAGGWVDLQLGLRTGPGREDLDIGLSFPPLVVDDVIVVGASHALGIRPPSAANVKGDIRGYDARTGELLWTFHTIPEANEFGSETWLAGSAEYTGNAGVWAPMSADAELGLVYLPIETPTGDYYGGDRPGDNLFGNSLVALDYRTGELRWYFQLIHHDIWDWDNPSAPVLADLPDGRKVIVQLTKQAMAYVFDRATGEPVWDIVETPVPASDVPGEWSSPTQPIPSKPAPYDRQGFAESDLVDFTPEIRAMALESIAGYRLSELFTPPSLQNAEDGTHGTLHLPNATGGSNWEGSAYDPETGVLYVPSRTAVSVLSLVPGGEASSVNYIQGLALGVNVEGLPIVSPPWGRITAIDLSSGEHRWWIANADTPASVSEHPLLAGVDLPRTGIANRAGILLTKTLLFAGEGNGGKAVFRAHDKATGEIVAEIPLPKPQTGTPITYMHDGRQYLLMSVSGQGSSSLVALALPE